MQSSHHQMCIPVFSVLFYVSHEELRRQAHTLSAHVQSPGDFTSKYGYKLNKEQDEGK